MIKSCESNKALGPNGFSMGLFKKCFAVIKIDLLDALNNFHNLHFFERSLNASYIVLIPKKIGAKELKDYRPISLIGSFYKLLFKALADKCFKNGFS